MITLDEFNRACDLMHAQRLTDFDKDEQLVIEERIYDLDRSEISPYAFHKDVFPPNVDIAELASNVFHKLVLNDVDVRTGRLDYA